MGIDPLPADPHDGFGREPVDGEDARAGFASQAGFASHDRDADDHGGEAAHDDDRRDRPVGVNHALAAVLDAAADRSDSNDLSGTDAPPYREPPLSDDRRHQDRQPDDEEEALAKLRAAVNLGPMLSSSAAGDGGGMRDGAGAGGGGPAAGPVSPLDAGHPEFQSIVRQSVIEQVRAHGEANPDIEVCGVLVGTVYESPQASFVYVDAMIRGESSSGRSTQVTFTAETWQHIHRVMEERHAGKRILGWYHTHPGFGIFLSEMDLFIQRHFFNAPWQVAFVYDPQSRDAGMFAWRAAQVKRVDFVLDDETGPAGAGGATGGPGAAASNAARAAVAAAKAPAASMASGGGGGGGHDDPTAPIAAAAIADLAERVRVLEGRVKGLLVGFAILLVATIIWPLVVQVVMPPPAGPARPASPAADPPPAAGKSAASDAPARPKPDRNFPVIP